MTMIIISHPKVSDCDYDDDYDYADYDYADYDDVDYEVDAQPTKMLLMRRWQWWRYDYDEQANKEDDNNKDDHPKGASSKNHIQHRPVGGKRQHLKGWSKTHYWINVK